MPNWGYSVKGLDKEKTVIASGRDLRISPKSAREVCASIRNIKIEKAKIFLEKVIAKEIPVAYKRYNKEVAHRRGLKGWYAGKYPKKTSIHILKLITALEANAAEKGLDADRLKIVHAATQHGSKIRKFIPRAFGRSSPYVQQLTHIELAAKEI